MNRVTSIEQKHQPEQEDNTFNNNIFNIINELTTLLIQDSDLDPKQLETAHTKFDNLKEIKEKIKGSWWLDHDLNTVIGQVLGGKGDFVAQRRLIQDNPELKQEYKKNINNEVNTIELIDSDRSIWDILTELNSLHTDFWNNVYTKNLDLDIANKVWEISILGVAYNLFNNASRFNMKDWDIHLSINNRWSFIFITSYNQSSQAFNKKNKESITTWSWNIESQQGNNAKNWQWLYLSDLWNKLKDINWSIQIIDTPSKAWGYHINVMVIIPYKI